MRLRSDIRDHSNTAPDIASLIRTTGIARNDDSILLRRPLVRLQRRAECFEQLAVDRIALRVVLGVPLDTERKTRSVRDPDRLDGAVLGDAFDDDALAGFENTLPVQRIHPDGLA